jgi:hypothetical protein
MTHRQMRNDLTALRIAQENGARKLYLARPIGQCVSKMSHIEHLFRMAAAAETRLVGDIDMAVTRQFIRERHHVALR